MIVLTCKQTRVFRLALVIIAKSRSFPVKRPFADEPMQSRFCRGNCFCLCRSLSCRLSAVKRKERRIDRPFFFRARSWQCFASSPACRSNRARLVVRKAFDDSRAARNPSTLPPSTRTPSKRKSRVFGTVREIVYVAIVPADPFFFFIYLRRSACSLRVTRLRSKNRSTLYARRRIVETDGWRSRGPQRKVSCSRGAFARSECRNTGENALEKRRHAPIFPFTPKSTRKGKNCVRTRASDGVSTKPTAGGSSSESAV